MPEVCEITLCVYIVLQLIFDKVVFNSVYSAIPLKEGPLKPLQKKRQEKFVTFISSIRTPFRLLHTEVRGHEWALWTSEAQIIKVHLGTGSYAAITKDSCLNLYPYSTLGNLVFKAESQTEQDALVFMILDCAQSRNQVKYSLLDGWDPNWNSSLGPCVLGESDLFKRNLENFCTDPKNAHYLKTTSMASFLSNPSVFNGFGGYMTSESYMRYFNAFQIPPWESVANALRFPGAFIGLQKLPEAMWLEVLSYLPKHYDPANFTKETYKAWKNWNYDFHLSYGQGKFRKCPVYSVVFRAASKDRTFWTHCLPDQWLPRKNGNLAFCKKSKKESFARITLPCGEEWFLIRGRRLSLEQLGVGPLEWHSHKARELLRELGEKVNQFTKGPQATASTLNYRSDRDIERNSRSVKNKNRALQRDYRNGYYLLATEEELMYEESLRDRFPSVTKSTSKLLADYASLYPTPSDPALDTVEPEDLYDVIEEDDEAPNDI